MFKKLIVLMLFVFQIYSAALAFSENTLDSMEISKYGKSYSNEDLGSRLRRLETDVFGMSQTGDVDTRVSNLFKMTSDNVSVPLLQPYDNFYTPEKKSTVRKFFDNISSSFSSPYITGYTPSFFGSNGYPNNIYGREYMNFLNNGSNYCPMNNPYYPRHYRRFNNHYHNGYNNKYKHNMRLNPAFRNSLSRAYRYNTRYNPYSQPYGYMPTDAVTNVATRSTVHILRD